MGKAKRKYATTATRKKEWQAKFLAAFALGATMTSAAERAGIDRTTVYRLIESNEEFAAKFADAEKQSADLLEQEARRRAIEGVKEPVIYQGKLMGVWLNEQGEAVAENTPGAKLIPLTVNKPSDLLMIFLLKGRRPEVFGERVDVTSGGKQLLPWSVKPDGRLSDRMGVAHANGNGNGNGHHNGET